MIKVAVETTEQRTTKILRFAQERLDLPDIVQSAYVDSDALWRRKEIIGYLQKELGPNVRCYNFWPWLVSESGLTNIRRFARACGQNQSAVRSLSEQLGRRNTEPTLTSSQRIINRYLVEYALDGELEEAGYEPPESAILPIYDSWSPSVNEREPFEALVLNNTNLGKQMPKISVLDIAAGRGKFSQFLNKTYGIPSKNCLCVDLSPTSTARTKELGFPSLTGDIKQVALSQTGRSFDLIYLGYCIDRDDQPKETLKRTRLLLRPEGILILEGLLPVIPKDSLGTIYTIDSDRIGQGKNLVNDMMAITDFVENNGEGLRLAAFALGPKLVRSLDGPELLSSSTFVFKGNESD